jgi:hypothetical protein
MDNRNEDDGSDTRVLSIAKIIPRKGLWTEVQLFIEGARSTRQAATSDGLVKAVAGRGRGGHWAVVIWADEAARKAYVHSGVHGKAAVKARDLARSHVSGHLPWDSDELPPWTDWERLLAVAPRVVDTRHVDGLTDEQRFKGPGRMVFPRGRAEGRPTPARVG